jgi:hypothetical protein
MAGACGTCKAAKETSTPGRLVCTQYATRASLCSRRGSNRTGRCALVHNRNVHVHSHLKATRSCPPRPLAVPSRFRSQLRFVGVYTLELLVGPAGECAAEMTGPTAAEDGRQDL